MCVCVCLTRSISAGPGGQDLAQPPASRPGGAGGRNRLQVGRAPRGRTGRPLNLRRRRGDATRIFRRKPSIATRNPGRRPGFRRPGRRRGQRPASRHAPNPPSRGCCADRPPLPGLSSPGSLIFIQKLPVPVRVSTARPPRPRRRARRPGPRRPDDLEKLNFEAHGESGRRVPSRFQEPFSDGLLSSLARACGTVSRAWFWPQ